MSNKLKSIKKKPYINYIIILVTLLIVFLCDKIGLLNSTNQRLVMMSTIYVLLAISLNLVVGILGELSLGHAGFMCVGAYVGALVSIALSSKMSVYLYFPISIISAGLVAAVAGVIIGIPVLRLKGDYVAIITLAFCQIIFTAVMNFKITGGASGLKNIPRVSNYLNCFIVLFISIVIIQNFIKSKHGRAIKAIRDNEISARACGVNITFYKLITFVIAAFFAGVAGCLFAHSASILKPTSMDYNKSIEILVMVVLGGMGNFTGSIIAGTALTLLPEYLRFLSDYRMIIYSIVLILIMIINNNSKCKSFFEKLKNKTKLLFKQFFNLFKKKNIPKSNTNIQNVNNDINLNIENCNNTSASNNSKEEK